VRLGRWTSKVVVAEADVSHAPTPAMRRIAEAERQGRGLEPPDTGSPRRNVAQNYISAGR
jgi:hypothetical protein